MIIDTTCSVTERKMKDATEVLLAQWPQLVFSYDFTISTNTTSVMTDLFKIDFQWNTDPDEITTGCGSNSLNYYVYTCH